MQEKEGLNEPPSDANNINGSQLLTRKENQNGEGQKTKEEK